MREKIVEILLYVLSEVRRSKKSLADIDTTPLEQRGYTDAEISTAFSWLFDRMKGSGAADGNISPVSPKSFRILHVAEQFVLSAEAHGYLIQLQEFGLLSNTELEIVIERAMQSGLDRLDIPEIQTILAFVLFDPDTPESALSRLLLHGNETIH